jgi:Uma2 family endonuclease
MGILLGSALPHVWAHRSWTSDEFEKLIDLGVFGPDEKLELIGGELIPKMTQNGPHSTAVTALTMMGFSLGLKGVLVRVQLPLRLGPSDRPEPDLALVEGALADFKENQPTTALLVVEVSDSTLAADRTTKASMYARAQIPEYWIVNLVDNQLEVHREPIEDKRETFGARYNSVQKLVAGEEIAPLAAPNSPVKTADLLL